MDQLELEALFEDLPWPSAEVHGDKGLHGQAKGKFLERLDLKLNRCLAPRGNCTKPAIKAHTVQNARSLELLQERGHIKSFVFGLSQDGKPSLSLKAIGRNFATTFEGFCSDHDTALFAPIDTRSLDVLTDEQLFLFAYRAVAREIYAQMDGAIRLQLGYQELVKAGKVNGEQPSKPGLMAVRHIAIAHTGWTYKRELDEALLSRNYTRLHHRVLFLDHTEPAIAAASCFTVPYWKAELARVSLNFFPLSTSKSVAIFSFLEEHTDGANSMLHHLFTAEGTFLKYLLSKLILARCENMVISPKVCAGWGEDKIEAIKNYFNATMSDYFEVEDERLYIFSE